MSEYRADIYLRLKEKVLYAKERRSNILVYTFAGSGCTHYLKQLAEEEPGFKYINDADQGLGEYNLLDLPIEIAEKYIKSVTVNQKYLLVVSSGSEFHSKTIEELKSHLYVSFPLGTGSRNDVVDMVYRFSENKSGEFVDLIMNMSGGIPKLAKYAIVHKGEVDFEEGVYANLINDIANSLMGYTSGELLSLGLVDDRGNVLPGLLRENVSKKIDLKINFDLSFVECGKKSKKLLSTVESRILKRMIDNGGRISKEEISDIKWGEGKYDEFSDQAINKQMRRLSQKLSTFSIKTIPKVGFEIK